MNLNASEKATLNFYNWEYRHRGYYHFDAPVDIEVPYTPFRHTSYSDTPIIDDGRAPSLFKSISNLLSPSKKEEESTEEIAEVKPRFLAFDDKQKLVGISLSFPKGTEILPNRNREFLNMLSFTEDVLSFEIIGTSEDIRIQIVCSVHDKERIESHFRAYFPTAIIQEIKSSDFGFSSENDIAIADFGLNDEYMRSIATTDSFSIDPLTSVIATMESLHNNDVVVFQILFKGITSPLAKDIPYAVSDGAGGSFFSDAPEMPNCAQEKIANPLFSVVMRIGAQGKTNIRSQYLTHELARSITAVSSSEYNKLIPLSNEGYNYDFHHYNLHNRLSNRLGFILNSKELNTFIHYPNKTIVSKKLGVQGSKTKQLPKETINQKYLLGVNEHNGESTKVMLNDEMRLRHTHIIGATGTGKSTLIANMMLEDMEVGNGCALFDPHGDIVEDVLLRIPEHRKDDVILINPYDTEFPIGFNILHANTDAEKIVLSSDIVSAFKRFATSWGDNMSSVLSQAVTTFLESSQGGTLIELKRFLLEDKFRKEFLETVDDPSIHYYWNNEYGYLKKRIAPLLTRIDTFLRPKIVRYMLAQKSGIDFRKCIDEKKIVLIKLSQGLIGEDNSYLLGSLFLSKFNQVAQSRQNLPKNERHPYYIYCDEFQNFITPSISQILSGARKYGLGLILAHQEIAQIDDYKTLNSVISNPYIRICFRLGDIDAKKLASGFSFFEESDLQSLQVGQAIVRIGSSTKDFNISTFPLSEINVETAEILKQSIIENTREHYAKPRNEINELLKNILPRVSEKKIKKVTKEIEIRPLVVFEEKKNKEDSNRLEIHESTDDLKKSKSNIITGNKRVALVKADESSQNIREHRDIQSLIQKLGQERGYLVTIEKEVSSAKRIDVVLEQNHIKIAFEISVTNTATYEVENIKKCIKEGCYPVVMISNNQKHLQKIQKKAKEELSTRDYNKTLYASSKEIPTILNSIEIKPTKNNEIIKGFRITTEYQKDSKNEGKTIRERIAKMLFKKR